MLERWDSTHVLTGQEPGNWQFQLRALQLVSSTSKTQATILLTRFTFTYLTWVRWGYGSAWMLSSTFPKQGHYLSEISWDCWRFLVRRDNCWHIAVMAWRAAATAALIGRSSRASTAG